MLHNPTGGGSAPFLIVSPDKSTAFMGNKFLHVRPHLVDGKEVREAFQQRPQEKYGKHSSLDVLTAVRILAGKLPPGRPSWTRSGLGIVVTGWAPERRLLF